MNISDRVFGQNQQEKQRLDKESKDRFMSIFGALSANAISLLGTGAFDEVLQCVEKYYIIEMENRLRETNLTNINLKGVEELENYRHVQDQYLGKKDLFSEMKKIAKTLEDLRSV